MKSLVFGLLIASLVGCTHSLHVHHMSDFGPTYAKFQQGQWISAESEQFVILGFVTQTDYVNEAWEQLRDKCRNGYVQGVQTEFFTDHGFFSWTNRVRMQGLCLLKG